MAVLDENHQYIHASIEQDLDDSNLHRVVLVGNVEPSGAQVQRLLRYIAEGRDLEVVRGAGEIRELASISTQSFDSNSHPDDLGDLPTAHNGYVETLGWFRDGHFGTWKVSAKGSRCLQ